ncbi:MAG: alpha/beta fold hydrolase [Candidatus Promineifilaceae bacterium]
MSLFRRALRIFILIAGVVAGMITVITAFFVRLLVSPPRQRLWTTPSGLGLPFEEIQFPARDGLRLSGWFIPRKRANNQGSDTTIILVHGWPWNRLGSANENALTDIPGSQPVQLLHLAHALHTAGYNVFMFDLRNHGQSTAAPPVTFGLNEANDLLGAIDYLDGREDIDAERMGVIGFSAGANTLLYALPHTDKIKAGIAVQPTSIRIFAGRYANWLLGPLGVPVLWLTDLVYQMVSGMRLRAIEPVFAAAGAGKTPILFVQGKGDPWGTVQNVADMADATPLSIEPLFVETNGRYGGYQYVIDHPEIAASFFREQMGP